MPDVKAICDALVKLRSATQSLVDCCRPHSMAYPWSDVPPVRNSAEQDSAPMAPTEGRALWLPPLWTTEQAPCWRRVSILHSLLRRLAALGFDRLDQGEVPVIFKDDPAIASHDLTADEMTGLVKAQSAYKNLSHAFTQFLDRLKAEKESLVGLEAIDLAGSTPAAVRLDFYRACRDRRLRGEGLAWAFLYDFHDWPQSLACSFPEVVAMLRTFCNMIPFAATDSPSLGSVISAFKLLPAFLFFVDLRSWRPPVARVYAEWCESVGKKGHAAAIYEACIVEKETYAPEAGPEDWVVERFPSNQGHAEAIAAYRQLRASSSTSRRHIEDWPPIIGVGDAVFGKDTDWCHYRLAVLHGQLGNMADATYHMTHLERLFRMGVVSEELYDRALMEHLESTKGERQAAGGIERHRDWALSRVRKLEGELDRFSIEYKGAISDKSIKAAIEQWEQAWSTEFGADKWALINQTAKRQVLFGRALLDSPIARLKPDVISIQWGIAVESAFKEAVQPHYNQKCPHQRPKHPSFDMLKRWLDEDAKPIPEVSRLREVMNADSGQLLVYVYRDRNEAAHGHYNERRLADLRNRTKDGRRLLDALLDLSSG